MGTDFTASGTSFVTRVWIAKKFPSGEKNADTTLERSRPKPCAGFCPSVGASCLLNSCEKNFWPSAPFHKTHSLSSAVKISRPSREIAIIGLDENVWLQTPP